MLASEYPRDWNSTRLRFICELNPSKRQLAGMDSSTPVSFVPMEKVSEDGKLTLDDVRPIESVSNGFTFFGEGDVVVAKITPCFENGKGAECRGLTNGFGFGTTEFHVLRPKEVDSRFLFYVTASDPFRNIGATEMSGAAGQKRVPESFLQNLILPRPPLHLQRRIAAYLDRETARIDALVTEKEALLRLLEEKRASLISHAVTRGLNPKAKLKPSGIPWLGDVPEHWSVQPLKRLTTTIKTGTTPNTEDVTAEGDFDWYTPGDFGNDIHLSPSKRRIFRDSSSFDSLRIFPAGTILFVGIGATLGKCSVSKVPFSANQQINAIVPTRDTDSVFLCLSLRAQAEGIRLMANASTIGILNQERTSAIPIAVPPPDEQRAIAAECLRISSATDTVITDIQTSIHLLREKRTSLISAAVTGEMAVD